MSEHQLPAAPGVLPQARLLRALGAALMLLLLPLGSSAAAVAAAVVPAGGLSSEATLAGPPQVDQAAPPAERSAPGPRYRAMPSYALASFEDPAIDPESAQSDPPAGDGASTTVETETTEQVQQDTAEQDTTPRDTTESDTVQQDTTASDTAEQQETTQQDSTEQVQQDTTEPGRTATDTTDTTGPTATETTETTDTTGPAAAETTDTADTTGPTATETTDTTGPAATDTTGSETNDELSVTDETDELDSTHDSLGVSTMSLGGLSTATPTEVADVITVVETAPGSYEIFVGGVSAGTVSGEDTFTVDGLGGEDVLAAPDLANIWKITGVNTGTLELAGGAKIAFSNVESLTGADTAADEFRFDDNAGLTGAVDDGLGQLTVVLSGFAKVVGDFTFERQSGYAATVTNGTTPSAATLNVLKLAGSGGTGFVGADVLGAEIGISGALGDFALAVLTGADQAWHAFTGTITTPHLVGGSLVDLDMHLDDVSVSMNTATKAPGSEVERFVDLSGPRAITTTGGALSLAFDKALVSATVPVLLDLGGFLFIQGDLTMTDGGRMKVDVDTGLDEVAVGDIPAGLKDSSKVTQGATADPIDGSMATNSDFSKTLSLISPTKARINGLS